MTARILAPGRYYSILYKTVETEIPKVRNFATWLNRMRRTNDVTLVTSEATDYEVFVLFDVNSSTTVYPDDPTDNDSFIPLPVVTATSKDTTKRADIVGLPDPEKGIVETVEEKGKNVSDAAKQAMQPLALGLVAATVLAGVYLLSQRSRPR